MSSLLQKALAGSKRPAAVTSDNMSTPRKSQSTGCNFPKVSPIYGQITFGTKIPPHGHQVQGAPREEVLAAAKMKLFKELPDSQYIIEEPANDDILSSDQEKSVPE